MNLLNFWKSMGKLAALGPLMASLSLPAYSAGKIVFVSDRTGNNDIYSMNADGTELTNLTNSVADEAGPSVSRDGSKIIFRSNFQIYSMDGNGTNTKRLTNTPGGEYNSCISPDGSKIASTRNLDDSRGEIYLMNADGTNPTRLTFNDTPDHPGCFNDDGSKIIFDSFLDPYNAIYEMNVNGTERTNLSQPNSNDFYPSFRNGKIVFCSNRDGNNEVYVMDADGSNQTRLTYTSGSELNPSWSPDGTQIVFSSYVDRNHEIYTMDADGSNPKRITNNTSSDRDAVWVSSLPPFTPTLTINDASINEGDNGSQNLAFTVKLSVGISRNVTVKVATSTVEGTASPGTDYTSVSPFFLTFAPGETTKTVNVSIKGDSVVEQDELFYVRLGSPTNAIIVDKSGTGKIRDDDTGRTLSVNDVTVSEGETAFFTVQLSGISGKTITVKVATSTEGTATSGSDYIPVAPFFLTFAPGQSSKTIAVPAKSDDLNESNELFYVRLGSVTNATILDKSGTGNILNNSTLRLSINDVRVNEGDTATFTIRLSAPSNKTVTVKARTRDETATAGFDYTAVPSTSLTFAPGETTQKFSVKTNDDGTVGENEFFSVRLSSPINATIQDETGFCIIANGSSVNDGSLTPQEVSPSSMPSGSSS